MIIKNKFSGYARDGSRIHNMGGGNQPTTSYSQTSNVPEYLEPFVKTMMGATEAQIYKTGPGGEITGFQPFQSYAQYAQGQGQSGETVAGFSPAQTQAMRGIQNYQLPGQTDAASRMTAGLTGAALQPSSFRGQGTAESYMSPYIQQALAPQMEEARRQYGITGQQQAAQAAQQGAFGGSRQGLVEAENARNLAKQQEAIYGQGMQAAFGQGQQQYNTEQQQRMAQIQQGLAGAGQMGALGQQQYQQQMGLMGQQMQVGAQQQAYEQARLNQIIQDYATSQQYPMMQLGVLSNMTRGLPMQSSSTNMYQAQPSGFSQMAGMAGTGLNLMQQYNKAYPSAKEGGVVKMASGGITSGVPAGKLPSMLEKLSDGQLAKKDTAQDMDPLTKDMVDTEQARRSRLRGMASGGAVAFADGEIVKEDPQELANRGITAESAKQKRITEEAPVEPVATPRLAAMPQSTGIAASGTTPVATETPTPVMGGLQTMRKELAEQELIKNKTIPQLVKEQQAEYAQLGIVNPAIAEQAGLKARKATVETDAQEMAKSRLIQFLIDWGKTPGSAVKGAINAGSNLIESSIGDEKLRRKMLNDLDAVDRDINKAEYLRQTGDVDKAKAVQRDAGAKYYAINEKILDYNAKIEIQELRKELAASKIANKNGVVQQGEVIAAGMIAEGAPDNAVTQAKALKQAISMQPAVTSAGISAASQQAIAAPKAAIAEEEASIKKGQAATQEQEATRKQKKDFEVDLSDEMRARRTDIRAAKKADEKAGIDPSDPRSKVSMLKKEIEAGVREDYALLKPKAAPAAPVVAKPAAAPAAPSAAPALKWDPKTNQFVK